MGQIRKYRSPKKMSLPFMKHKDTGISGVAVKMRKPDEKPAEDDSNAGMEAVASDILRAIEQKDVKHLALALQNAFQIFDMQPHEEFDHSDEGQE